MGYSVRGMQVIELSTLSSKLSMYKCFSSEMNVSLTHVLCFLFKLTLKFSQIAKSSSGFLSQMVKRDFASAL